jgi:hypothetical protein
MSRLRRYKERIVSVFRGQTLRNTGPYFEGNTVLQSAGNHAADDKVLQLGHESTTQKALPSKVLIQKRKPPPNQQQQTRQCRQPRHQTITEAQTQLLFGAVGNFSGVKPN